MRLGLICLSAALCAAPAFAQPVSAAPLPEVQRMLADPATVDRLADTAEALSKAFLDLPVGNVEAALEGRPPTRADGRRTVGDETGLSVRDVSAHIAAAKPVVQQRLRALNDALPHVM